MWSTSKYSHLTYLLSNNLQAIQEMLESTSDESIAETKSSSNTTYDTLAAVAFRARQRALGWGDKEMGQKLLAILVKQLL
jgi:hypothetical protein